MTGLLWLALACGASGPAPDGAAPAVALRVFLDGPPRSGGGTLVLQAEYDPGGDLQLPEPVSTDPRLTFTPDGPPVQEQIGERRVVTQRYLFRGPDGSYEIPPLTAEWRGGEREVEGQSTALFVDLGVEPPRPGELADIVEPAPIRVQPWAVIAGAVALFVAGLLIAFRPRPSARQAPPPPIPPDRLAIAAWERVRDDPNLTIDDKAQQIARIFRDYVEAVLGFEATSRTTHELLQHLEGLRHLPEGNVPRARRVLRAADRVKFAEERPGGVPTWLAELDSDLRAFVESTRPSSWVSRGEP